MSLVGRLPSLHLFHFLAVVECLKQVRLSLGRHVLEHRVVEIPLGLVNFGELISKSLHFLVSLQTNYFELVLELRLPLLLLFSDVGVLLLLHFELLADLLVLVVVLEDDLVEHVVLLLFIYFFFLT